MMEGRPTVTAPTASFLVMEWLAVIVLFPVLAIGLWVQLMSNNYIPEN